MSSSDVLNRPSDICAICDTELLYCGDAGWRHAIGFKARGGCTAPIPLGETGVDVYREHGSLKGQVDG